MKKVIIFVIILVGVFFVYSCNSEKINKFIYRNYEYKFEMHGYLRDSIGYKQYWFVTINTKTKTAEVFNHFVVSEGNETDVFYYKFELFDEEVNEIETLIKNIKNNPEKYSYNPAQIETVLYFEVTINNDKYVIIDENETKLLYNIIHSKEVMSKIDSSVGERYPLFRN